MNKRKVGGDYETIAAQYLEKNGYRILARNYRCRIGEIDLIASERNVLCFIEVKYRTDHRNGDPLEAVTFRKQVTIRKTASWYMAENRIPLGTACRFDAVGIEPGRILLVKDAFGGM